MKELARGNSPNPWPGRNNRRTEEQKNRKTNVDTAEYSCISRRPNPLRRGACRVCELVLCRTKARFRIIRQLSEGFFVATTLPHSHQQVQVVGLIRNQDAAYRCILKKCFDSDRERSIFRKKISGSKYLEITKSLIVMYVYAGRKEGYGIPRILESSNNIFPLPPRPAERCFRNKNILDLYLWTLCSK
jgi:hypothetical protein